MGGDRQWGSGGVGHGEDQQTGHENVQQPGRWNPVHCGDKGWFDSWNTFFVKLNLAEDYLFMLMYVFIF